MSQLSLPRLGRGVAFVVFVVLIAAVGPRAAHAASGSTLTPDHLSYVVNKDVGAERWTINLNLASLDPQRPSNVTGNVYRSGQSPSFVWCQVRDDSNGTLANPGSVFRLRCSGASACGDTATGCAQSQWSTIADPVEIPASFFLPPGGDGIARAGVLSTAGARSTAPVAAAAAPVVKLAATMTPAAAAPAAGEDRGTNLPPDGANFLVNKELAGQRWSISLNRIPAQLGDTSVSSCGDQPECIISSRFLNVTGNVYPSDGGPPQFVYCQTRKDSTGDLADPQSMFRFGCVGAGACQKSASECAQQDWQGIPGGSDVSLPASFFLPPGGLPATPQSDPDIVVIGRTSDPPSVVVPLGNGASALGASTVQGCGEGGACTLSVGSCGSVQGSIVLDPVASCACKVDDVPPECITCGDGASGVCGGDCQYQVGGSTARGQCLPFSSTSSQCACYAANQASQVAISICGGALGNECPAGKCCADDIRDGCDPAKGDVGCGGICVDSNGCDPTVSQCGSCLDQRDPQTLFCGTLEAPAGASCCQDCPDGSQSCYCQPGRSCNLEADGGGCCPTSKPDLCNGTSCIPSGADCCADCPDGGTGCYCTTGSLCVLEHDGGGCCPLDLPVGCGGNCYAAGTDCCADGSSFCDPGQVCIDTGSGGCCDADTPVGCGDFCLPPGSVCCNPGDGTYCDAGFKCEDPDLCVPVASSASAEAKPRSGGVGVAQVAAQSSELVAAPQSAPK